MRTPLPPLPPPPLGKDRAATAAPFAARRLDLIRSSLAPPPQKHHPEPSPKTPIRLYARLHPAAATVSPGGQRRRTDGDGAAERPVWTGFGFVRAEPRKRKRGQEPWTSTERDSALMSMSDN